MRHVQMMTGMIFGGVVCFVSGMAIAEEIEFDLNQDGLAEKIVNGISDGSESEEVPIGVSTLEILTGTQSERLVLLYGDTEDDFSEPVVHEDVSGDGIPDIIVPRPSHNEVVVIESFWDDDICDDVISIERGHSIVKPIEHSDVFDFGFEVLPLYDIDGDEIQDIQIGAHYIGDDGEVHTRTYIYSGLHRTLRGWADPDEPRAACPKFHGDVSCNGEVTHQDLDTTLANFEMQTSDRTKGELNGDGIVNGLDVVEVLDHLGSRAFEPMNDPHAVCEEDEAMYRTFLGDAQWSCVTTVPYDQFHIVPVFDIDGQVVGIEVEPELGVPVIPPKMDSCRNDILDCWDSSQEFREAFMGARLSCGDDAFDERIKLVCRECTSNELEGFGGYMKPVCPWLLFKPRIVIVACTNSSSTICETLAHEFIHAKQACELGLFEDWNCGPFMDDWNDPSNVMCRELQAYKDSGDCETLTNCCIDACSSAKLFFNWTECETISCDNCCIEYQSTCCIGSSWNHQDIDSCPPCIED